MWREVFHPMASFVIFEASFLGRFSYVHLFWRRLGVLPEDSMSITKRFLLHILNAIYCRSLNCLRTICVVYLIENLYLFWVTYCRLTFKDTQEAK